MLHNVCVLVIIDWLSDIVFWSLSTWMMWKCVRRVVLWCDVGRKNGEMTWTIFKYVLFCLYDIYTYLLSCFFPLVRNVITHSLCVVCVWIIWWSWTLCSGEQMTKWVVLRNLMLKDVGTQYSDRMWHWGISFYINYMKS